MKRITMTQLRVLLDRLNELTNSPKVAWVTNTEGKSVAQIGNYHLSGAYGGWKLERMMNESGGVVDVLNSGYVTKRELFNLMHAYIDGLEQGSKE